VESKDQDAVYTVGMRGVHDGGIAGYNGAQNIAKGLSQIIETQRKLIQENIGSPTQVPQMFCPYKEVLDAYNTGNINLPEDITLCWVDDNHGYIRQFPSVSEQKRSGSNGIYYHLSYWGSPQDYLWLSSIFPSLISYELGCGYEQGIQRLWVINVGDIKPAEEEIEFCMDLAWDVNKWNPENAAIYSREWAARTFGEDVANEIGDIKQEYYRLAAAGKPEHVSSVSYTMQEMDYRIAAYKAISERVEAIKGNIPDRLQSLSAIVNPGFEQDYNGWTINCSGTYNTKISTGEKPTGATSPLIAANQKHLQIWGINGSGSVSQTIEGLEDGQYELGVTFCHTGSATGTLFANNVSTAMTSDNVYKVVVQVTNHRLNFGVKYNGTSNSVIDIDSFTLRKIGATGIQQRTMNKPQISNRIYDLSGNEISMPQKGIYITNGKKIIK